MWILLAPIVVLGLIVGWKVTHPSAPQLPPAVAPPVGADATSFATVALGQVTVAAFLPQARDEMVKVLGVNGWVMQILDPGADIVTIGPRPAGTLELPNALTNLRDAARAGLNVFADADLALKLAGSAAAPPASSSPVFVAVATGLPPVVASSGNEQVASTPAAAVDALDPAFPGSRFVLFARAGEVF